MTELAGAEARLVAASGQGVTGSADLADSIGMLDAWLQGLQQALRELHAPAAGAFRRGHPLAAEMRDIEAILQASPTLWAERWRRLQPAKDLAASFESRIMLLVFGKFNAGKSSLCNLLAERWRAHGQAVEYFHLAGGKIMRAERPFEEGATETTSRLQGVMLGEGLLLLDTPGLHSVTPDNADLTRRFTDSADALLWLTSSTSPGQVQELDELARELHRNKPLLPVITRSDVIEEDEVDGEIVKRLRNKSPANRQLQENDVEARALGKLAQMQVPTSVLEPPISVSVRAARDSGLTATALEESGLERLYEAMSRLVEPAMDYKRRKPVEVLLHHLEETVLGGLATGLVPALSRQADHLVAEQERLSGLRVRLASLVWRQVGSQVATALEGHESMDALPQVCRALEGLVHEALVRTWSEHLGEHASWGDRSGPELAITHDAAGGFDYQQVHDDLQSALRQAVEAELDSAFAPLIETLDDFKRWNRALQECIGRQRRALMQIKDRLRSTDGAVTAGA